MSGRRVDGSRVLNPGVLHHQIRWQQKAVSGQNSIGEDVYEWVDFLECRAWVRPLEGKEVQTGDQKWGLGLFKILQHYVSGLSAGMRILWSTDQGDVILDVLDVNDAFGTRLALTATAKNYEEAVLSGSIGTG